MYYEQDLIDQVRDANDIVDVIGSYISLKKKGSNYVGICPFHNDSDPSLSVSRSKQIYKCFACGESGNVFTFLMKYENMDFGDAVKTLADRAGIELPQKNYSHYNSERSEKIEKLKEIYKTAAVFYYKNLYAPEGADGLAYFKNRGLSDETITKFGLGYSLKSGSKLYALLKEKGFDDEILQESMLFNYSEKYGGQDKFWNRVMFPILDKNSKVIAFGGRVMGDGEPKYLNSNETLIFDKSSNLYGFYLARRSRKDYMLLCEGYMDVIALHQAGFDNAVASLGTALTEKQAALIARCTKRVVITYDSDGAGRKAANRAIPILKAAGIMTKVLNMQPYKDPDEFIKALGTDAYQARVDEAVPSFDFMTDFKSESFDLKNADEKEAFINEMVTEFCRTEEPARSIHMQEFATKYGYPLEQLKKLVSAKGNELIRSGKLYENTESGSFENTGQTRNLGPKKEDEAFRATEHEKLVFTWAGENEVFATLMRKYLKVDDFTEGLTAKVAEIAYGQLENGRKVIDPAAISSCFELPEEQAETSSLFLSDIWNKMNADKKGIEQAFVDAVIKVLEGSLKKQAEQAKQAKDVQKMLALNIEQRNLKTKLAGKIKNDLYVSHWQM